MKNFIFLSKAFVTMLTLLSGGLSAFAHDFEVNGIYYKYIDETAKTVEVTYKGSSYTEYYYEYTGAVTIPSSVTYSGTTYSVTSIGSLAFYYCMGLTSVTIPNSVTEIGNSAFRGCHGLTSIVVENGNSKYDSRNNCNAIVESSTNSLIIGCKNTTIPNSVTEIGNYAFYGCSGLTSITIPNSVTEIGNDAFWSCDGLTEVTIPNSVTEIGNEAFSSCDGLTSVTIGNSVTEIGDRAFYGCSGLTEVNISDLSAWCKIGFGNDYANPLCYAKKLKLNETEITNLVIPNDISQIKDYTFYNCDGLTSITIPNSVTSIGNEAFSSCSGLTSVTIPNSVTEIGYYAFADCI